MAASQRPAQRVAPSRVFTPAGWLTANFHITAQTPFLPFLNRTGDFFTLTDVKMPGHSKPLPFLALQRSATILIVPPNDEKLTGSAPEATETTHQISCLLERGVLMGTLELPSALRVSDYLMHQAGFIVLRDCTLGLDEPRGIEALPIVVANADRVVGVAEM